MARLIVYYAHPGHRHSNANTRLAQVASQTDGITFVDLYRDYPRFDIDVDVEQQRLVDHDVVLFQFPFFWYSTPSILKEWQDLVLEHGFAYGTDGDRLAGKRMLLAITAAGPHEAYAPGGYQRFPIREFLRPFEQTARLCGIRFSAPYVLYGSLRAPDDGSLDLHVDGYRELLAAIRDDRFDWQDACDRDVIEFGSLPLAEAD